MSTKLKTDYSILSVLFNIYQKLNYADFPSPKAVKDHLVDFKKIKGEMEVHDTFIETFKQKYEITEQGIIKDEKGIKAYTDFLAQEVEIELNLIDQDVIDQVNLKPVNIIMLEELNLIKQDEQDEKLQKRKGK